MCLEGLANKAAHALRVAQILDGVDHATGKITDVDTGKTVHLARVATHFTSARVGSALLSRANEDIVQCPSVVSGALVPVVWDTFVTIVEDKFVVFVTCVAEEGQEHLWSQEPTRFFRRVIGVELKGEHVGAERKGYAGVWWGEVVWVLDNTM